MKVLQGCRLFRFYPCTTTTAPLVSSAQDRSGKKKEGANIVNYSCDTVPGVRGRTVCQNTQTRGVGGFTGKRCRGLFSFIFGSGKVPVSMIVLTPLIPGQLSCPSCFAPSRFFFNVQPKLVFSVFHPGLLGTFSDLKGF